MDGKLMPMAIDFEESILGTIMMDNKCLPLVIGVLKPEYFYKEAHQHICSAMLDMYRNSKPIDLMTVAEDLKTKGFLELVGGYYYISSICGKIIPSTKIEFYSKVVAEKYMLRSFIELGHKVSNMCYSETHSVSDVISELTKNVDTTNEIFLGGKRTPEFMDVLLDTVKSIEKSGSQEVAGISTGNSKIDKTIGGWMDGELIVMAGRPGQGKTVRALNHAVHAAKQNKKVLIFSLEMTSVALTKRILSDAANVENWKIRTGDLHATEWERINNAIGELSELPITIEDRDSLTIEEIRAISKMRKMYQGVDLVIVDYLQIIKPSDKKMIREQQITEISRGLKSLAKELMVPVIALAQLSREVEKRDDKRPIVSDLRESGSIEQEADVVIGLYRPSTYYEFDKHPDVIQNRTDWNLSVYEQISEFILLKFRDGDVSKKVREYFHGKYYKYSEGDKVAYNTNIDPVRNKFDDKDDVF